MGTNKNSIRIPTPEEFSKGCKEYEKHEKRDTMYIFLGSKVTISSFITHSYAADLVEYCVIHHEIYTSDFII